MAHNHPVCSGLLRIILVLALLLVAAPLRAASAASFPVPCGDVQALITAIHSAEANPGPDTIDLAAGCVYTLIAPDNIGAHNANGLPVISSDITINGNGATLQRSSALGTPEFRIFQIGSIDSTPGNPGAVLRLNRVTIHGAGSNSAATGGDLDTIWGGAIYNNLNATLIIRESTLSGNTSPYGGAILNWGMLTIESSTLTGNTAINGGGIDHIEGVFTLTNSTLVDNIGENGAAFISWRDIVVTNSTLAGGDTVLVDNRYNLILRNTILASGAGGQNCTNPDAITDEGGNLQTNNAFCAATIPVGDPHLGPLQDNGGPTQTMALLSGSQAVEMGVSANCPRVDQRGFARPNPENTRCDAGAFETGGYVRGQLAFSPGTVFVGRPAVLTITLTNVIGLNAGQVAFNASLPGTLVIASPNHVSNTCGGTLSVASGSQVYSLSGGQVNAGKSCAIQFEVVSPAAGQFSTGIISVYNNQTGTWPSVNEASLTVTRVGTSLELVSQANPIQSGSNVTFTATVLPGAQGLGAPGGTVTFNYDLPAQDGAVDQQQVSVPVIDGVARLDLTYPMYGDFSVQAVYPQTDLFEGSTSAEIIQFVQPNLVYLPFMQQ